ncbi:cobalamin-dependent protein [Streptomyces sp. CdTB01]|uniref:cobalamin B12-binding domain-containing protein n=1 Tax=Streptomyces sp. CdTB01 TaxID=1725411 RepID=UPI00073AD887|nr:cobalamin-dependent protein [Streptomyces sp. CdTB01]ALV37768.1 cobalamin-binding protein [Streptomyces sp. CdTB01]
MTVHHATRPDLDTVRDRLWTAVRAGDEYQACAAVLDAVGSGLDAETVLLDVIGAVQLRVGTEWAANRLTVAEEHAATAIHERVVAALAHHPEHRGPAPTRARVTVACVDGEWHALPARLLAEVLRRRGWQVDFLGAQVPTPHLIAHLHQTGSRVVALSATLSPHLPTAHAAITACQAVGVPVVAGGAAFGPDGRHARALGADAWAAHARDAAEVLDRGLTRPDLPAVRQTVDDLPHLTDQEYTMVVGTRRELLKETLVGLEHRFPPMRAYSERQRQRTAEDIGHILDHLAASLYVADEDLFRDFIAWTADVLTARDVPARSLDPALELLAQRLQDFPRATRTLASARETLATHSPEPRKPGDGQHA